MSDTTNPDSNEHERLFIESFVVNNKKERFFQLINYKKGREKFRDTLYHADYFDKSFIVNIPGSKQHAADVEKMVAKMKAPKTCHVISADSDLDKLTGKLTEVLNAVVESSSGSIISFIPGKLAYYEGEEQGARFILYRNNSS